MRPFLSHGLAAARLGVEGVWSQAGRGEEDGEGVKLWRRLCCIFAHVEERGRMVGASRPDLVFKCCCQRTVSSSLVCFLVIQHLPLSLLFVGRIRRQIVRQSVIIVKLFISIQASACYLGRRPELYFEPG